MQFTTSILGVAMNIKTTSSIISAFVLLLVFLVPGCSSGIAMDIYESLQSDYERVCSELETAQAQCVNLQDDLEDTQSLLEDTEAALATT